MSYCFYLIILQLPFERVVFIILLLFLFLSGRTKNNVVIEATEAFSTYTIIGKFAIILLKDKNNFSRCKKLFGYINHHQLQNEYVLHNFCCFFIKINCKEHLVTIQQIE